MKRVARANTRDVRCSCKQESIVLSPIMISSFNHIALHVVSLAGKALNARPATPGQGPHDRVRIVRYEYYFYHATFSLFLIL